MLLSGLDVAAPWRSWRQRGDSSFAGREDFLGSAADWRALVAVALWPKFSPPREVDFIRPVCLVPGGGYGDGRFRVTRVTVLMSRCRLLAAFV